MFESILKNVQPTEVENFLISGYLTNGRDGVYKTKINSSELIASGGIFV